MTYIYIDESGDLGLNEKSSDYFLFAGAIIHDEKTNSLFNRLVKKVRQKTLSKKFLRISELKFSNSSERIREMVLSSISRLDIEIFAFIFIKNTPKRYIDLMIESLTVLLSLINSSDILIYADKCLSKSQQEEMRSHFIFEIIHDLSETNGGLQATDYICGAVGQKFNNASKKYYELISSSVKYIFIRK